MLNREVTEQWMCERREGPIRQARAPITCKWGGWRRQRKTGERKLPYHQEGALPSTRGRSEVRVPTILNPQCQLTAGMKHSAPTKLATHLPFTSGKTGYNCYKYGFSHSLCGVFTQPCTCFKALHSRLELQLPKPQRQVLTSNTAKCSLLFGNREVKMGHMTIGWALI